MDKPPLIELPDTFRVRISNAIRFWEPRRVIYNLVLSTVVVAWLVLTWPHFRPVLTLQSLLQLLVLAAIANVFYCTAYFADIALQGLFPQGKWQILRWGLWSAGMLFAVVFTCYWIADEIYPYVG